MTFERHIANAFRMDDATWARHANPWSVWTRVSILPLLFLAAWSRVWIGDWAWLAIGLVLAWTWWNPRLFPPPATMDSWASRGVLGERHWLARDSVPIPAHHRVVPRVLTAGSAVGLAIAVAGVVVLSPWATVGGLVGSMLAKLWFLDRMVWLQQDIAESGGSSAG
jgi:hypothetical protein